jgi:hypothetical protein
MGIEELTAPRESLAELRRKEAYVLCDNPSAGIDRLVGASKNFSRQAPTNLTR